MAAQVETVNQTFTYASDGKLNKSDAADGASTVWSYYPDAGGDSPDVGVFLDAKWKDDTWQTTARTLKAAKARAGSPPRVMAEFQYQTQDKVVLPLLLKLYGYNSTRPDEIDTVVILEGVTVSNVAAIQNKAETTWTLELVIGRKNAVVQCQATVKDGTTLTVTERRYWGKERQQLQTRQTRTTDMKKGLTTLTLASLVNDATPARWQTLSTEQRSSYSGRLLRRTVNTQQQRFGYDALGRVIEEITYTNDAKNNDVEARSDKALATVQTRYEQAKNGCIWMIKTYPGQPDSPVQRVLYDGLQQVTRIERQRLTGKPVKDTDFCPTYDSNGTYDYLPGGLQRQASQSPTNLSRDLIWAASSEKEETLTGQTAQQIIEETLGNERGPLLTRLRSQQNLSNGGVIRSEDQRLPDGTAAAGGIVRSVTEQTFDPAGRMTQLKQTFPGVAQGERLFKIDYDELDRPVTWTGPDGASVKRAYAGMGDTVNKISVTSGGVKDPDILLGTQTVENNRLVKTRSVGTRTYSFGYTDDRLTTQILPDTGEVFSETSTDGNTITWKAKSSTKATAVVLATFAYDPLKKALSAVQETTDKKSPNSLTISAPTVPWNDGVYTRTTSSFTFSASRYRSLQGAEYIERVAGGRQARVWRDRLNRRTRTLCSNLDYHYLYNAWGECERTTVRDMLSGRVLKVSHTFDSFGQEITRSYRLDGTEVEVYQQEWSSSGQLLRKTVTRKGVICLDERFTYDKRERIKNWTVDSKSTNGPRDSTGRAIRSQSYEHDVLNNLKSCDTVFVDGSTQRQEYTYSADNPTQRSKIVTISTPAKDAKGNTPPPTRSEKTLQYDANGYLTQDDLDRKMTYTLLGQLHSVSDKDDKLLTRYEYDEQGRLASQWDEKAQQRQLFVYSGDALCAQVLLDTTGKELRRLRLDNEAGLVAELVIDQQLTRSFIINDPQNGVSSEYPIDAAAATPLSIAYTPWGECDDTLHGAFISGLGFNGARHDPLTGAYHLGNGYRVYQPAQRVFLQPDSASPFGKGGINNYAYCGGDPVNLYDPDGHVMISRWGQDQMISKLDQFISDYTPLPPQPPQSHQNESPFSLLSAIIWGAVNILISVAAVLLAIPSGGLSLVVASAWLAVTVVSSGLSIASAALQNSNPELASKLNWAATGIDIATMVDPFKTAIRTGARLMRWVGNKAGRLIGKVNTALNAAARNVSGSLSRMRGTPTLTAARRGRDLRVTWGNIEPQGAYDVLDDTLHMSTDLYKGEPRVIFEVHGTLQGSSAKAMVGEHNLSAAEFIDYVQKKGVDFSQYKNIKMMMCYSANGDVTSFASDLARRTGLPVKGYKGPVDVDYYQELMNPDYQRYGLHKALENRRGQYVDAIKVEKDAIIDGKWVMSDHYRPVKFSGWTSTPSKLMSTERFNSEIIKRQRELTLKSEMLQRLNDENLAKDFSKLDLQELL